MKIQIVIPAINLWQNYTKPCLDSLKSKHDIRILVINNGSTDETQTELNKFVSDSFFYQTNTEPWCCSKSWNFGIKDGFNNGADYILVLNNDVLLHPDCIDRMVERFEKGDEDVVMVTAMDRRGECPEVKDFMNLKSQDFESVAEAEHPNFSAFMINKKYWEKIGEFDEEFVPCYFEDNSSHYKVKLASLKAIVYPPALFYHFGSRTWNEGITHSTLERNLKFERNREIYVQMWGGLPGSEIYKTKFNK